MANRDTWAFENTWEYGDRNKVEAEIDRVIAKFPATFHLPACPHTARISKVHSYFSGNVLYLYTEVLIDGRWESYCKGTESELRRAVRP